MAHWLTTHQKDAGQSGAQNEKNQNAAQREQSTCKPQRLLAAVLIARIMLCRLAKYPAKSHPGNEADLAQHADDAPARIRQDKRYANPESHRCIEITLQSAASIE